MDQFITAFQSLIDWVIVGIVIMSGFFQKRFLSHIQWSKDSSFDSALKTAVVSLVVSVIYIHLIHSADKTMSIAYAKYFISYFAATSLYEMILRPAIKAFGKKTGIDIPDDQIPKP